MSEGCFCGVLLAAGARAREINDPHRLDGIHAGAHDEGCSQWVLVLTVVELASSYIQLGERLTGRDEPAWWAALTARRERNLLCEG